ncbi:MAG: hypothetical protein PHQ04_03750 [Opitutaceae bacterium]|nr:hypothetical protein [Opitutaceae bacterium]
MNRRMNPDELEKFIHRTLRSLPERHAPGTLEARVLAEIERRAAIPWWHKSYAWWPAPVRVAFLVISAVAAAVLVLGWFAVSRSPAGATVVDEAVSHFGWFATLQAVVSGIVDKAGLVWRAIPPLWIHGALAFLVACYATLIGVGAAAYRTFTAQRPSL